jgi:hypothetical protein
MRTFKIVYSQANLLQIVGALHSTSSLACGLHRRQQKPDENADDRDHDQQLNQGKTVTNFSFGHHNPQKSKHFSIGPTKEPMPSTTARPRWY